jgi:hypothetical protein
MNSKTDCWRRLEAMLTSSSWKHPLAHWSCVYPSLLKGAEGTINGLEVIWNGLRHLLPSLVRDGFIIDALSYLSLVSIVQGRQ